MCPKRGVPGLHTFNEPHFGACRRADGANITPRTHCDEYSRDGRGTLLINFMVRLQITTLPGQELRTFMVDKILTVPF